MNTFYKASSVDERGTLSQLKNDFDHRQVTTDVMNSFNYANNFSYFITHSHIIALGKVQRKLQLVFLHAIM